MTWRHAGMGWVSSQRTQGLEGQERLEEGAEVRGTRHRVHSARSTRPAGCLGEPVEREVTQSKHREYCWPSASVASAFVASPVVASASVEPTNHE